MIEGDCFKIAANLALFDEDIECDEIHLVHGLPVGCGLDNQGKRFWHAWIEITKYLHIPDNIPHEFSDQFADMFDADGDIELVACIDRSNGLDVTLPKEVFYRQGSLDEDHVWRYTPDQTRENLLKFEHYGPWVDGWEDMNEV
jgi:hypothetical protein